MARLKSNLQLSSKIGEGFFGEVYAANDDVHGEVAVKVLRQNPSESAADWQIRREGLLREGQRLSQATHNNVLQVHQLLESESNDEIHLVMEFCKSGSLQSAFDKGPLSLKATRQISTQVALGLHALHARGMLHRDIKPSNLMRHSSGVIKLGDFGLVTDNIILGYGSQAGYLDHVAPEVINGTAGTSAKSDIWALGMTIYRLLHGAEWYSRLPSPGDNVANGGFARSLPWLSHIPEQWRRFVRKMLHDDSQARYQNTHQVMGALANLPTEPDWTCSVATDKTSWRRRDRARKINVIWEKHSPRKYSWSAWSEPVASGNRRTLGTSSGQISRVLSEQQLKEFFSS